MKNEKYEAGQTIQMACSSCGEETVHNIETVTKQGKITKAACQNCQTTSVYNKGVKTSVTMGSSKTAAPYDRTHKYRKGDAIMHASFGQGEVTAVIEPQKIDVLFGSETRRLIHAQN